MGGWVRGPRLCCKHFFCLISFPSDATFASLLKGVEVVVLQIGDGQRPRVGGMVCNMHGPSSITLWLDIRTIIKDMVTTHYVGTIVSDGSTFGSSLARSVLGEPKIYFFSPLSSFLKRSGRRSHLRIAALLLSPRLVLARRSKAGTRVCPHSVGQSVTLLMVAVMARCPTANTGVQSNIEGITRLRACRVRVPCVERYLYN